MQANNYDMLSTERKKPIDLQDTTCEARLPTFVDIKSERKLLFK